MFYKLIKRIHINIGEELTREIPNGNPRLKTSNYFVQQPERVSVSDFRLKRRKQNFMIHRLKKLFDVALQYKAGQSAVPAYFPQHCSQPIYAPMRSLFISAGIRIIDERLFKNGIQRGKNRAVKNSVPDTRFVNVALFGVSDVEAGIWTVPICLSF